MPEELPLVTVVTPVSNIIDNEKIDEFNLLTTLLNLQMYPRVEHLVIDKASKDGTVQLLMDYKSKGYIQMYTEPDSGRYEALTKGIMHARGKYVTFLNCDDFMHDITALMEIVRMMEEYDAAYTFSTAYAIHPEGYVFSFAPTMYNVFQVMPCALQGMVFKKSVLAQEGYFDTKFKLLADYDLILRLFLKEYPGLYYDKNYVTYRISETVLNSPQVVESETRQIFIKNYRNMFGLTNEIVDKISATSEFPPEFLDKLAKYFPEESKSEFLEACENMHQMRLGNDIIEDENEEQAENADEQLQSQNNSQQVPQAPQQQSGMGQTPSRGLPPQQSGMGQAPRPGMSPQQRFSTQPFPQRQTPPPGFSR